METLVTTAPVCSDSGSIGTPVDLHHTSSYPLSMSPTIPVLAPVPKDHQGDGLIFALPSPGLSGSFGPDFATEILQAGQDSKCAPHKSPGALSDEPLDRVPRLAKFFTSFH